MKKFVLLFTGLLIATSLIVAQNKSISGFSTSSAVQQFNWEEKYDQILKPGNVDKLIKDMSARPHHVGSPGGKAVAEYIQKYFQDLGYD